MSGPYDMVGTIKLIYDTMTFPSGFSKREFVITTDDKYPQDIKLAFKKESAKMLDEFKAGDRVKVAFRIRGNEYKERYYVDLDAFKLERLEGDGSSTEFDENMVPEDSAEPADDSDMPF